ncbi:uncharacterized protein BXIN_0143 [Babesia sp. Xinjiang]|uniref:uncharacterized protein n=1 Tax=Babesia sp. Xinjiang TaxID=462227 RepID=UPI000A21F57B|nr:uncharacterized protein BXIN_0143 [Babesia sp. Xinjiang]ORM39783.1 hypothetical protein BXIN_0143 [Babesia sp. Xinjiang]
MILQGLFFIAIQQFLLGISLYSVIHYLHPSMTQLAWLLFGANAISAVLGFFGALKRNIVIECVYLVFYFLALLLVFLTVLDMAELVHLLPKGPQMKDVYNFASMRYAPILRAGHPHVFLKQREEPFELDDHYDFEADDDEDPDMYPEELLDADTDASTDLEDIMSLKTPEKTGQTSPPNQSDVTSKVTGDINSKGPIEGTKTEQGATADAKGTEETKSIHIHQSKGKGQVNENVNKLGEQPIIAEPVKGAQNDSLYDHIPLVPHFGETEGEAEEVSKDELPPETHDLTPEGISEVVAIYKIQKRPLKMAAAGLLTIALMFNVYCYWVAVTFVLNKCTCLDELVSHPEQFTPLID